MDAIQTPDPYFTPSMKQDTDNKRASPKSWVSRTKVCVSFVAVVFAAYVSWLGIAAIGYDPVRTIAGTLASIAATMVGFVVAAASILLSVGRSTLVSNMRKTGHYDVLVTEFVRTVVIFLLSMMILIVALFLPDRLVKITTLI